MVGLVPLFPSDLREVFWPIQSPSMMNLQAVRNARGDINEIRMLLKGDEAACLDLFRQAIEEGDAVAQIQLSQALTCMKRGKDSLKDFSSLVVTDLEEFAYYPKEFVLFESTYTQLMGPGVEWEALRSTAKETFALAANRGYLPALLELKHREWINNRESYGFAAELRPFVGKGDRLLDYHFGYALKRGCQVGSALYYEGMYWMHQSLGITVKVPDEDESYKRFLEREVDGTSYGRYDFDGFRHASTVVFAPSMEKWETFVREKLETVRVAPLDSYLFSYDAQQIKSLLNEYKLSAATSASFVEHPMEGNTYLGPSGEPFHGFNIDSLTLFMNHKKLGEISVRKDTFELYETISDPRIQPVVEFVQNVMMRSGSAGSAHSWLRRMGGDYI